MMPLAFTQIGLVAAWLGLVGGVAEGLRRTTGVDTEITRKNCTYWCWPGDFTGLVVTYPHLDGPDRFGGL